MHSENDTHFVLLNDKWDDAVNTHDTDVSTTTAWNLNWHFSCCQSSIPIGLPQVMWQETVYLQQFQPQSQALRMP